MESFATPYPVVFQDGEGGERDVGYIGVHPALAFKRFQQLLGQKTGVAPQHLGAVFVCRKVVGNAEKRVKLPINENTNFNMLLSKHSPLRERDVHFLVFKAGDGKKKGREEAEEEAAGEAFLGGGAFAGGQNQAAQAGERQRIMAALGNLGGGPKPGAKGAAGGANGVQGNGQGPPPPPRGGPSPTVMVPGGPRPLGSWPVAPAADAGPGGKGKGRGVPLGGPSMAGPMGGLPAPRLGVEYVVPSIEDPVVVGFRGASPYGPVGDREVKVKV